MPCLKYIIQNATTDSLRLLRGKTIECISLIGLAVGREKVTAYIISLPVHGGVFLLLLLLIMMLKVWSIFVEGQVLHDLTTVATEGFGNGCEILPPLALRQTFLLLLLLWAVVCPDAVV